jgi:hypothetical protein
MKRGRPESQFEDMPFLPGFRATADQKDWLEEARLAAGETSLSEWIRKTVADAGEQLVGKPFPRRKVRKRKGR